jgi:hypothetical protein
MANGMASATSGATAPTERPDAGHSDDGTGQDIREHGTATQFIHEYSTPSEGVFRALQKPLH